jgi:predicted NUDIX family phosphoesterase
MIMVVERDILFDKNDSFHGFRDADCNIPYEKRILGNYTFKRRGDMENNPSFKQPIAYCIIVNIQRRKFFVYQRDSKNADPRITSNWSWGVGGHIEQVDIKEDVNPLYDSMLREISEEVKFVDGKIIGTELLGYINDDTNSIGSVHFGLLYLLMTDAEDVQMNSNELQSGRMVYPQRLEILYDDESCGIDTWSRIAMIPLRKKFGHLGFSLPK